MLSYRLSFSKLAGATVTQFQVMNDSLLVSSTAFFILSKDKTVGVLAFRGTEPANIISILTDANSQMTPFFDGEIHSGFDLNTGAIWALINKRIISEEKNLKSLYITGHSLGGAMSVVTAAKAQFDNISWRERIKGIYTYGQPMVGNDAFADACKGNVAKILYRHVYSRDVIPRAPTRDMGDFKHFGEEYFSPASNKSWKNVIADPKKPTRAPYFMG